MPAYPDEALHALLDDLSAPLQQARPSSAALLPPSATPAFGRSSLPDALATANAALEAAGASTRLQPLPDSSAGAAHDALAAALGAIVQLARGCEASARLRKDAEAKVDRLQLDVRALGEESRKRKVKIEETERRAADAKRSAGRAARRAKEEHALLEKEKEELRSKLAAVVRREGVLVFEGRRRDKELAKLQARVHDMLASRDAVRPPMVTAVAGTELGYSFGEGGFGDEEAFYQAAENWPRLLDESYEERQECLVEEGRDMRIMLRNAQLELDELLLAKELIRPAHGESDQLDREDDDVEEKLPRNAPSEDQMRLPFTSVQEELETSFRQKFALLRAALEL